MTNCNNEETLINIRLQKQNPRMIREAKQEA